MFKRISSLVLTLSLLGIMPVYAQTAGQAITGYLSTQAQPNCAAPLPCFVQDGQGEFNVSVIPTVQNASYTAGQSLGGLQTFTISTTNGVAGILDQIQTAATDGATAGVVAYVWSKNPTNTTCTDKTNFVKSQVDNEALVVQPQLITPAIVVSGQDTTTYGSASNLVGNFVNGSTNGVLYACFLTNATVTPGTTTNLRFNLQGIKK